MKPVSKVDTATRIKARLRDHADWWRKNRKVSKWTVTMAVRATYAEIKRNPELGTSYEAEGSIGIRFMKTPTEHALYYVVVEATGCSERHGSSWILLRFQAQRG